MEAIVPLAGFKSIPIQNLVPGNLFYTLHNPVHSRFFRLRVSLAGAAGVGIVSLDGGRPFDLAMLRADDANAPALHVPVENLHMRLGMGQVANVETWTAGNLFVTPGESFILVSKPGMGGQTAWAFVSTETWLVTEEHPVAFAVFSQWQLITRKAQKDEVILSVGGLE